MGKTVKTGTFFAAGERKKLLTGGILLTASVLLQLAARRLPWFGEWYAVSVYPILVGTLGRLCGIVPFSVSEFGLYLLAAGILLYGIRNIRRQSALITSAFLLVSVLAFSYTANCGINYFRRPFSFYLGLEVRDSSVEELISLNRRLAEETAESVRQLERETARMADGKRSRRKLSMQAKADMERLGEQYPQLDGFYPAPKPVAVSEILSIQSLSGVYSPFTIEANYNQDMTDYNIPHTACHELSHLRGFMREDEANFIGYLACVLSQDSYSRYSGYLTGFLYANHALYRQDPETASEILAGLPEYARKDLSENNRFWSFYEGRIAETSARINDAYLKANSQSDGVKSYGKMVDLLLAYYRKQEKSAASHCYSEGKMIK